MKKRILLMNILLLGVLTSCTNVSGGSGVPSGGERPWYADATIYELNTRQFTPEGTFQAAEAELERLAELGIDLIWVMPVQPIGVAERKGTLGSYYAIKDYKGVNPEFGTHDDFRSFVSKAHSLGIKVILDWVANHTSPDALWVENDGWHKRDDNGKLVVNYDWYDISQFDYGNEDMRAAMIDAMIYWVETMGVDGFRCDMAMMVPLDFWREAKKELLGVKPDIFMLAEAEETYLVNDVFDMYYAWELHHLINAVAQGRSNVRDVWNYFGRHSVKFPDKAIPMVFTSNHDENSHSDTEFVRMGAPAAEAFAVFSYVVPSMPLIYTGQEVGNVKRLEFFEKDNIVENEPERFTAFYRSLNNLRKENQALHSGLYGADMVRIENSAPDKVMSLRRSTQSNEVVAVLNLSNDALTVQLDERSLDGEFSVFPGGGTAELVPGMQIEMEPWQYIVYTRNK